LRSALVLMGDTGFEQAPRGAIDCGRRACHALGAPGARTARSRLSMRNAIRRSILPALLVCTAARQSSAQAGASADTTGGKSNVFPGVEIIGFLTLLSVYDRFAYANAVQDNKEVYSSTLSSTWDHLRTQRWVHDQDPFNVNQVEHPYQGATTYGLARSSGDHRALIPRR
jgi:hypothetical protein